MKKISLGLVFFALYFIFTTSGWSLNLDSLLPDERNTIEVFQKSSSKVVYVHRLANARDRFSRRIHVPDGAGSGIIWDDKGHVVTNFHVIKGADDLAITLGSMTVPVKVIGKEPRRDIAVLAIKSPRALAYLKSYKPFEIVHLRDLIVGQKAIAIGNPFGLDHSLSKGVISALGRKVPGIGGVTIRNMIQTDTPINPGNSGGPLLNSRGQLIGLNTMIYSQTGSSAGIGFAVPADDIDRVVTQIIKNGRVVLSGIGIKPVEPSFARKLGVKKGILIARVLPHTPAAQLKLRGTHRDAWGRMVLGDVIVGINSHPTSNYDALYNLISDIRIGERVTVSVLRGNKKLNIKMKTIDIAAIS